MTTFLRTGIFFYFGLVALHWSPFGRVYNQKVEKQHDIHSWTVRWTPVRSDYSYQNFMELVFGERIKRFGSNYASLAVSVINA